MVDNDVEIRIRMDMAEATSQLNNYLITLRSAIRLARRMGLPDVVDQQLRQIQQLIRLIYQLRMAYYALLAARTAAGDPLAIAQAGIAIGGAVLTSMDVAG